MTRLIRRSPLAKRIKALKKELAAVDSDLKALSKGEAGETRKEDVQAEVAGRNERRSTVSPSVGRNGGPDRMEREVRRIGRQIRDQRFADYLSTSFQSVRPLRHERRIQRNKAILMIILAGLALFWVLYRFFL